MKSSTLIGNIIVYVTCLILSGLVVWQIAHGQASVTWHWFRGFPLVVQLILALVFLPWLAALWVWQSAWPVMLRALVTAGIMLFVLVAFFPRPSGTKFS